jgi:hypothetical protein
MLGRFLASLSARRGLPVGSWHPGIRHIPLHLHLHRRTKSCNLLSLKPFWSIRGQFPIDAACKAPQKGIEQNSLPNGGLRPSLPQDVTYQVGRCISCTMYVWSTEYSVVLLAYLLDSVHGLRQTASCAPLHAIHTQFEFPASDLSAWYLSTYMLMWSSYIGSASRNGTVSRA